jgi:hypothetical protein
MHSRTPTAPLTRGHVRAAPCGPPRLGPFSLSFPILVSARSGPAACRASGLSVPPWQSSSARAWASRPSACLHRWSSRRASDVLLLPDDCAASRAGGDPGVCAIVQDPARSQLGLIQGSARGLGAEAAMGTCGSSDVTEVSSSTKLSAAMRLIMLPRMVAAVRSNGVCVGRLSIMRGVTNRESRSGCGAASRDGRSLRDVPGGALQIRALLSAHANARNGPGPGARQSTIFAQR